MADEDFTQRVGIDMDTFFKKSSMIDIDSETKTVHFFPTKYKGKKNVYLIYSFCYFRKKLRNLCSKH